MAEDVTWRLGRSQEEMEPTERSLEQKKSEKGGRIGYQEESWMARRKKMEQQELQREELLEALNV